MFAAAPTWLLVFFSASTLLSLFLFYRSTPNKTRFVIGSAFWLTLQAIVSYKGFYTVTDSTPPRFILLILPPTLFAISLFFIPAGKRFIDSLDLARLHWVHTVRIPVEISLLYLFYAGLVPELMTFEGRNFDILAGLAAPLMVYLYFGRKSISKRIMIAWNFISILLLANIVVHAVLSAPFAFQQMAFEQPNIGVLYFPFTWLPGYIVPLVLFSNLASLRLLFKK